MQNAAIKRTKDRFRFRDTRLCFSLPATLGDRGAAEPYERLRTPEDFARWCAEAGLVDRPPPVDEHKHRKALELREAVQRVGESIVADQTPSPSDIARINFAASEEAIPQLSLDATTAIWVSDGVEAALSRIARDAIDLFCGPFRNRIRICANPKCVGLFVDESRPGQRRWCSMSTCGDMAKKARLKKKTDKK